MRKSDIKTVLFVVALFATAKLGAQNTDALGSFTPYSVFGVGDLVRPSLACNRGMGGTGVGIRNNRFVNITNPGAIYVDTLSFMFDFGLKQDNFYSASEGHKSAYNVFNMDHIVLALPIYRTLGFQAGVVPYSNVGYKFEDYEERTDFLAELGGVSYLHYGDGGINKAFFGAGASFFNHLSIGAKGIYYFGCINRNSDVTMSANSSYSSLTTGYDVNTSAFGAQLGLQLFGNVGKLKATLGAAYTTATSLKGEYEHFAYATYTSSKDTTFYSLSNGAQLSVPSEMAFGLSLSKPDVWTLAFDYLHSDWSNEKYIEAPGIDYRQGKSNAFRMGFEYTPDRYSIRYFLRRITYRVGAYREQSYIMLNGNQITSTGFTLGVSIPVNKYYNSIGFSVDLGQRGTLSNSLVRERYAMFVFDFSLHELWFIKHRYN